MVLALGIISIQMYELSFTEICHDSCPMECSMSSDATSWSCTISLRSGTSTSIPPTSPRVLRSTRGTSIASASSAASAGVTPTPARASTGVRSITTQSFGPTITDKSQVELWLRRAQGAILSTDADKSQWLNKSAEEIRQAIQNKTEMRDFTEDTIVVDIQDPTATDLSFVDLPGKNIYCIIKGLFFSLHGGFLDCQGSSRMRTQGLLTSSRI